MEHRSAQSESDASCDYQELINASIQEKKKRRNNLRAERNQIMMKQIEKYHHCLRKEQSLVLYFIQITHPLAIALLVAASLTTGIEERSARFTLAINGLMVAGLFITVYTNLLVASWKQILLLYFYLDDVMPILVVSVVALYELIDFLERWSWVYSWLVIFYPVWLIYFTGNLRVTIKHVKWSRWQILLYKLSIVSGGMCPFYTGMEYMDGKYKVTNGYYVPFQTTFKNLVLIHVFALTEMYFELFRRLSDFDRTSQLQAHYQFKGGHEKAMEIYQNLEKKDIKEQQAAEIKKEELTQVDRLLNTPDLDCQQQPKHTAKQAEGIEQPKKEQGRRREEDEEEEGPE